MSKYLPINLFIRQALLYPLVAPFLPPVDKVEAGYSYAAGNLIGTLAVGGGFGIPKTGQTVKYRDGDDGDFQLGMPDAPPRFADNGDGTISDLATGLMWVKQPENIGGIWVSAGQPATQLWNDAVDNCIALVYAGHDDWRLPNIFEIVSILNVGASNPSSYSTFFPNTIAGRYWSSSTNIWSATYAGAAHFYNARHEYTVKTSGCYVRPVRGPD